jgi:hypothetical protein
VVSFFLPNTITKPSIPGTCSRYTATTTTIGLTKNCILKIYATVRLRHPFRPWQVGCHAERDRVGQRRVALRPKITVISFGCPFGYPMVRFASSSRSSS